MKDAYIEIAQRAGAAAEATSVPAYREFAVFLAYHSFESVGGALVESYGQFYPRVHPKKMNVFVATSPPQVKRQVQAVATVVSSLRDRMLYPEQTAEGVVRPKDRMKDSDVADICRRVRGVVAMVEKLI